MIVLDNKATRWKADMAIQTFEARITIERHDAEDYLYQSGYLFCGSIYATKSCTQPQEPHIEEPFLLKDAIGRIAPFHFKLICSWEAFQSIVEVRFRDPQGAIVVQRKQYVLQDQATGRGISLQSSWERAFLPGQRVTRTMVFHQGCIDVSDAAQKTA